MSTPMESQTNRERSVIYIVVMLILAALTIGGLFAYSSAKSTQEAQEKADQLIAKLEEKGARTPSRDQIVQVLGDDGGAVCADPNEALPRGIFLGQLANGSGGPGTRPVIVDNKVVQGQLLIIEVYCPDELAEFQKLVDDLKLDDDVAGD
jgi:hypothetical protein